MKNRKETKVVKIGIIIINILIFIIACLIIKSLNKNSLATFDEEIDINTIIENNLAKGRKEELRQEEREIQYTTIHEENINMQKGTSKVVQKGINGKEIVIMKMVYEGENLISEEICSSTIIKPAVNEIIQIGIN